MTNVLNTNIYTIRTEQKLIAEVQGIEKAVEILSLIKNKRGVAVFMNGEFFQDATFFTAWATRMNNLINYGIDWNGEAVA